MKPVFARRTGALLGVALLAACGSGESENALAGTSAADQAFNAFLASAGQNFDACFEGLPNLSREGAGETPQSTNGDGTAAPARVVLAVDASGSMAARVGGETKMDAAKAAAADFLTGLPEGVEIGLLAFGHRGNNSEAGRAPSCRAVEMVQPLGPGNRDVVRDALGRFSATGWTPLAAAIEQAGAALSPSDTPGAQIVYVVSDGEETCGGDPVAAARQLRDGNVRAVVNVIGFDLTPADRAQLRAVAEAGGGSFVEAANGRDLRARLSAVRTDLANRAALARTAVNTAGGQARNAVVTSAMLTRANACVSRATTQESLRLTTWLRENPLPAEVQREVSARVTARGRDYAARLQRLDAVAQGRRSEADAALQADYDRLGNAVAAQENAVR